MSAVEEADALVCKVRAGRISARDALRILKRLEEVAKPEEAEGMKQARAIIEDAMATVREMGTLLRLRTFHSRFVQRARRERAASKDGQIAWAAIGK